MVSASQPRRKQMKMNDETKAQLQVMWETLNGLLSDVQDCIDRLEAIGIGMDDNTTEGESK